VSDLIDPSYQWKPKPPRPPRPVRHQELKLQKYRNAANVPPGLYQNYDLTRGDKIFARVDGDDLYLTNDFRKLKNERIQRCVYFSAANFPLIVSFDYRQGTVFRDWMIPTASYRFLVTPEHIEVSLIEKNLSLAEYTERMYKRCIEEFRKIYEMHDKVYLHYSGGIDSLVCLSFIMKLGYEKKTTLLYFRNLPEVSPLWRPNQAFLNPEKMQAREALWKHMADRVGGIIEETVTLEDYLRLFNQYEFEFVQCYSTADMLVKYPDGAHLGGHLGNESLLHWILFMDDLLLAGHDYAEFEEMTKKPIYAREHVTEQWKPEVNLNRCRVPLDYKHHIARNRFALNQRPVKFYHPLMDEDTSEDMRRLHWKDIGWEYLLDAKLARDIMTMNVGDELDQFVTFDGREADDLSSVMFHADKINPEILTIPTNLNHHPDGPEWHRYVLSKMHQQGITSHTALSFKAINTLSKLVEGEIDLYRPNPQPKF
jgi:hypothetical protein